LSRQLPSHNLGGLRQAGLGKPAFNVIELTVASPLRMLRIRRGRVSTAGIGHKALYYSLNLMTLKSR
jgi:hypothetical protein